MTTRAELQALLARIEAASGPDREIDAEFGTIVEIGAFKVGNTVWNATFTNEPKAWVGPPTQYPECPHFTASLDAIVGLICRELPRWSRIIEHEPRSDGGQFNDCLLEISHPEYRMISGEGASEPLACCAAFIRSKLAMLEGSDAG